MDRKSPACNGRRAPKWAPVTAWFSTLMPLDQLLIADNSGGNRDTSSTILAEFRGGRGTTRS